MPKINLKLSRNKIPKEKIHSKKKKSILERPSLPYLLAFFIPILVMLVIFAGKEIYPFGDRSFLRTDLYHQYAPFFQEYKDKLSNMESLYYSWDIGLGTNFLALYAYYLSSPLNWFLAIWPRKLVIEFITYGIVLRMALSSLSFTYYLNKRGIVSRIGAAFFGIFYGLSGYMAAYSWNIMWLDCLVLFPLIMLGLERLVKQDKCLLYCISLALCIYSNYYISIMVCISAFLYFVMQFLLLREKNCNYPKKVLNFAIYSLLAGGLAAIMLIPEIAALSTTASASSSFPKNAKSYFTIMEMLGRHLMNVEVEIGLDHWPNIYCGVAVLFLVPLYFMNHRIPFREKMAYFLLLTFFLLSFSLDVLNFIWHGFHFPNSLPCRQSFIYIFFLLSICFEAYKDLRRRTPKEIIISLALAIGFVILTERLSTDLTSASTNNSSDDIYYFWYSFYLSIAFIAIYGGLSHVYNSTKRRWKGLLVFAAAITVFVEATINMSATSVTTVSRSNYVKNDETTRTLISQATEEEENDFFRVARANFITKNDGAWLDYHSASIFSSTAYADLTAIYKKLGLESSTNAYGTQGSSFATNMLLGIRYTLAFQELQEDDLRSLFATTSEGDSTAYLYKNSYALPLGFMVSDDLSTDWNTENTNPADNWNSLAHALGISDDLFVAQYDLLNNNTSVVTVTTDMEGYVYLYVDKSGPNKVKVASEALTGSAKTFSNLSRSYFIALDSVPEDSVLTVTNDDDSKSGQGVNLSAYVLDADVLARMYEKLSAEPLEISNYSSTKVSGTVTSEDGGIMFTSIPYDEGWSVLVDGEAVSTSAFENAFLSFQVPAGTHSIELSYTPSGFWTGVLISLVSLIVLVTIRLLIRQWKKTHSAVKSKKALEAISDNPATAALLPDQTTPTQKGGSEQ